jgi:hypothetical protein
MIYHYLHAVGPGYALPLWPSTVALREIAQDFKTDLRFQSSIGGACHYSTQSLPSVPCLGEGNTFIFLSSFTFKFIKLGRSFRNSFFHFYILSSLNLHAHALLGILFLILYLEFTKPSCSFRN